METLTYKGEGPGSPAEVELPGCGIVKRGGQIDVPDDVAKALVAQAPDNWGLKKPAKKATAGGGE